MLEFMDFSMNVELSNRLREQNAEAPSAKFMKLMEIDDGGYHVMPSIKRFDSEKQKVGMKSITDLEKTPFANDAEKMEAYVNQIESRVAFVDKIKNGELDFSAKNLTTTQGFVPTYNINKNADSMRLGAYTSGIKGDNVKIEVPTRDSYAVIYGKVNSLNDTAPSKTDHIIVNTGEKVTDSMLFAEVDKNVDKKGTRAVAEAYLKYLYTEEGQDIAGKHFYRPAISDKAKAKYAAQFPKLALFTIDEAFGGWSRAAKEHFADGAHFDQIYTKK